MRLATIEIDQQKTVAFCNKNDILTMNAVEHFSDFRPEWRTSLDEIIRKYWDQIRSWYSPKLFDEAEKIPKKQVRFHPPYINPPKIWGIGLNYQDHASDLNEESPQKYPASFMRPTTTIIGHSDTIEISSLSKRTTGEAELGIIIGKEGKNIKKEHWLDYVAGFVPIIDMTAEDILEHNTRYLTLSKSFDTYFSFGPEIVSPDEINMDNFNEIEVTTMINQEDYASNILGNMSFPPADLVSFHSKVMKLQPGDIISTGTPRAVKLEEGDTVSCKITNFPILSNPVNA